jgi:hypothetical protein
MSVLAGRPARAKAAKQQPCNKDSLFSREKCEQSHILASRLEIKINQSILDAQTT